MCPAPRQIGRKARWLRWSIRNGDVAGFHRIGIHPNRNEASLYSWTQVDGKIVSRAKCTGLAIPAGPLTGAALAGVTLQTPEPLRTCRIQVDQDGVRTDLLFESFTGPVQMNMDEFAGASIGAGHYDSLGRVRGSIESGGISHSFDGIKYSITVGAPGTAARSWRIAGSWPCWMRQTISTPFRRGDPKDE